MHPRFRHLLVCAAAAIVLAACGAAATPTPAPTARPTLTVAAASTEPVPGIDATVVVGNGVCSMTLVSDVTAKDIRTIHEDFVCEVTMSDPRVSGTQTFTAVTRFSTAGGTPPGAVWTATGDVLTNDGGTWRGDSQGVVDLTGVLPYAKGVVPFNYGEGHYVGEGGYAGLEYHYYITGGNEEAGAAGWIVSTP